MKSNSQSVVSWSGCASMSLLLLFISAIFAPHSQILSQTTAGQQTLTNSDIIRLVQGHLGPDLIVDQIRANPGRYSLRTDGLLSLKHLGVPDKVIAAMQEKMRQVSAKSANELRSATPVWTVGVRHITYEDGDAGFGSIAAAGEDRRVASITVPVRSNGHAGTANIVASCQNGDGSPNLWFRIYYASQDEPVGFSQNHVGQTIEKTCMVTSAPGPGGLSIPLGGCGYIPVSHSDYIPLELNVDSRYVSTASDSSKADRVLFGFANTDSGVVGSVSEGFNAHLIRVKLPLTNGDSPTVDIHPQDPSFRSFAERCDVPREPSELNDHKMTTQASAGAPVAGSVSAARDVSGCDSRTGSLFRGLQTDDIVSSSPPAYPPVAATESFSGVVRLEAVIGTTGHVCSLKVLSVFPSGYPVKPIAAPVEVALKEAAIAAVSQWVFRPVKVGATIERLVANIDVKFPPK